MTITFTRNYERLRRKLRLINYYPKFIRKHYAKVYDGTSFFHVTTRWSSDSRDLCERFKITYINSAIAYDLVIVFDDSFQASLLLDVDAHYTTMTTRYPVFEDRLLLDLLTQTDLENHLWEKFAQKEEEIKHGLTR